MRRIARYLPGQADWESGVCAREGRGPEDLGILQALIHADILRAREEREAAARARAARQRHANPESCSSWNVRAVLNA